MENKKEKKVLVLTIIAIIVLIITVVGATYAYFVAQGGVGSNANVNVQTSTTDNLSFSIGEGINITADQEDFGSGAENKRGSTEATATLTANNYTNSATRTYNIYLNITNNEFEYTTEDNKGELILKVTGPEGEVTSIEGLNQVTSGSGANEVTGLDITGANGLISIASNYEISTTSTTTQEWNIEVIFVNLDSDQNNNTGKTFKAEIIVQEEETAYHEVCQSGTMACDIARLYNESNASANGLYYHNGTIVDENEYCMYEGNQVLSFPNGNPSTNETDCQRVFNYVGMYVDASIISFGMELDILEEVTWSNGICVTTTSGTSVHTDDTFNTLVTQEQCNGYAVTAGSQAVIITELGSGAIEKVPQILDAEDYSYRYAGADPNNYVCFGSDEATCPEENLYRIIGVFEGKIKLIKYDYVTPIQLGIDGNYSTTADYLDLNYYKGSLSSENIGAYVWSSSSNTNQWSGSYLNTLNLNTNYLNYLGNYWSNLVCPTTWQVGGNTWENIGITTVKNAYTNEIVSPAEATTYQAKIGLMYVSDYGYAASPDNWSKNLISYNNTTNTENNWLYFGGRDWTISRVSNNHIFVFYLSEEGDVDYLTNYVGALLRPAFYLKPDVILTGGIGTKNDPYRIAL